MIAIRLTQKNYNKILNESPIDPRDLEAMISEYDTLVSSEALYFVPQHELTHTLDRHSWMTLPRKALDETFKYDPKIDSQFVEITHK